MIINFSFYQTSFDGINVCTSLQDFYVFIYFLFFDNIVKIIYASKNIIISISLKYHAKKKKF